jgi:hypothetical protein
VKYFSGTATYVGSFDVPEEWVKTPARLVMDLGKVRDLAEVCINGKSCGIAWMPPYRVDIAPALKAGKNELQIKVTNEWTNRIAGDRLMPEKRILAPVQTRPGFGGGNQALPESGLFGPVTILVKTEPR